MGSGRGFGPKPFLDAITTTPKRRRFVVVDIESKDGDTQTPGFTRPFLVGLYDPDEDRYQEFRDLPHLRTRPWEKRHMLPGGCVDQFMNAVLTKEHSGKVIYAHNGGSFDYLFMLAWLRDHRDEFEFEVVPIQSSIQVIRVRRREPEEDRRKPTKRRGKAQRWEFLDSMRLMPMGLDRAAKTFAPELEKGKLPVDLGMHEDDARWSAYLEQDCLLLASVMMRFYEMVEDRLGGQVGITAPSTAMQLFRRKFIGRNGVPERIYRHQHWHECEDKRCAGCAHDWIRRGYYGGRTEIFRMRGEGLKYLDVNSSYVASMREDMPIGDRYVEVGTIDWRRHPSRGGCWGGFAECTVYIPPGCPVPPLPSRARKTGKLVFQTGRFTGVWSLEELALLEDPFVGGRIERVVKTCWFRLKPMFGAMVDELWRLRDRNQADYDEGLSALAKLLGNSTYGKFAMKQERSAIVFARDADDSGRRSPKAPTDAPSDDDPSRCFLCGDELRGVRLLEAVGLCEGCEGSKPANADVESDVWYQAHRVDASYVIPHVSAHITALARVRLWRYMKMAVERGGKLYYCDSVTSDRTTIVRGPKGIEVLTFEELWGRAKNVRTERGKEFGELPGYSTLSRTDGVDSGWSPIERVIRHHTQKRTLRISTKHGQTQVTTDHGIIVGDRAVGPETFVEEACRFERAKVPRARARRRFDLLEYLRGFSHERLLKRGMKDVIRFVGDDKHVYLDVRSWAGRHNDVRFRRFYERGSEELRALLRLIGAYVCDGSSSIKGLTTETRFMLAFAKWDESLQKRVRKDLLRISRGLTITGPFWTGMTFQVASGTVMAACVFAALCGFRSRGKFLPSLAFELSSEDADVLYESLSRGDAHVDANGQMAFTSTSPKLAAGVSLFLGQHGIEHLFHFRPSNRSWLVRTRPTGSERPRRYSINVETFEEPVGDGYVYDLTVAGSHTFVDGIGQVLLHNTDSIITDVELPTSNRLGDLKDEYPGESLRYMAVQPKVYMIERMNLNADVERRRGVIDAAARGEDVDASTLDGTYTKERDERAAAQLSDAEREILTLGKRGDAHDASTLDAAVLGRRNYILQPDYKVTMKGFPGQAHQRFEHERGCTCDRCALSGEPTVEWVMRSIRNRENLERLADGETLEWRRLQKVRTLARDGFKNGPQMADVSKSFRSRYDKRIVLADGIETEARVVDEHEDEEQQDEAEAAE